MRRFITLCTVVFVLSISPMALAGENLPIAHMHKSYQYKTAGPIAFNAYMDFPTVDSRGNPTSKVTADQSTTRLAKTPWTSTTAIPPPTSYTLGFNNPSPLPPGKGVVSGGFATFDWGAPFQGWTPVACSLWNGATPQVKVYDVRLDDLNVRATYDGEFLRLTAVGNQGVWAAQVTMGWTDGTTGNFYRDTSPDAATNSADQGPISGGKYLGKVPVSPNSNAIAIAAVSGDLNSNDCVITRAEFMAPHTGDSNTDGNIDFTDMVALSQNYNQTGTNWATGDFNDDHVTDFSDLVLLSQSYNTSYSFPGVMDAPLATSAFPGVTSNLDLFNRDAASLGLPTVPEPGTLSLLALAGLIVCRRPR